MQNKRGQGLSTNAIILIVLGVIVLVILMLGFTIGWEKFAPWISKDNVDTVVNQCQLACSTQSVYNFCSKERELKAGGEKYTDTCFGFATSEKYTDENYGIQECGNLCGA